MAISDKKLPFDGNIEVLSRLTDDYIECISSSSAHVNSSLKYEIFSSNEPSAIERSARKAALASISEYSPLVKLAFDTRRINQEKERNPRSNLQYWHRSEPFITEVAKSQLSTFSKLLEVMKIIKDKYDHTPEWFNSYSRVLLDNLERILRLNLNDDDFHESQFSYLEQLLFARYRLEMNDIIEKSPRELEKIILEKDEDMVRRKPEIKEINSNEQILNLLKTNLNNQRQFISHGDSKDGSDPLSKLFGAGIRQAGEKKVSRTITINIVDSVIE